MSTQERQRIIKNFTFMDWVELTEQVYGWCGRRFPYTKKQKQKLLTKAHKLGLV